MTPEVVPREYAIRSVPLIRNTERLSLERERETFFLVRELPLLLTLRHLASRFTLDIPDLPILSFFIQNSSPIFISFSIYRLKVYALENIRVKGFLRIRKIDEVMDV